MPRSKTISDEAVLASCRETFLTEGVGVSTRSLAANSGVSEGVLFQRFNTKDDLFFAAMRLPAPDLSAVLARARDKPTEKGLIELASAALRYLRGQMPVMLLVLSHPAYLSNSRPASLLMDARALSQPFFDLLAESDIDVPDPQATAQIILSMLISRALHEAVGVNSQRNSGAWLTRMVAALAAGFG